MTKLAELKKQLMQNEGFRREYEKLEPEFALFKTLLKARAKAKMSQVQVAEKLKTSQAAVARLESGKISPSIKTLRRYAAAVGAELKIQLIRK